MRYEAPAKINLNLIVSARDARGFHPIRSVVQTVDWVDSLGVEVGEADNFSLTGAELPDDGENLVVRAIDAIRTRVPVPPLEVVLEKFIPIGTGMGGGSSDAAAALVAVCELVDQPRDLAREVAPDIGADVSFPLVGGTAEMSGYGEEIKEMSSLDGFALGVVVPDFSLSTPDVYQNWDWLGEPEGFAVPDRFLPPVLRNSFPIRNDLYRAAVDLEPRLGDFVADAGRVWGGAVMMTGSGSACFGFFANVKEAAEAVAAVPGTRAAKGVSLRLAGVARVTGANPSGS